MLNFATKQEKPLQRKLGIETILSSVAIALAVSIFLKAILDVDNHYDPGWYHLPFAARLGGILPKEMFIGDEKWFEPRFDGFPLLAHFLQGWLWRITGRIQAANLVSYLAIISYFFFLRSYFQVPLYLSAIALFSIPLVLTHASTSFVDLLGNVGTSMLVMMTYSFYKNQQPPKTKELLIAFVGAAIAVNTKTQLQPLVFAILIVLGIRLIWLYRKQQFNSSQKLKAIATAILATIVIFATPVKNTVLYQNPLYPIKIEVAGIVLNHKLSPEAYEEGNRQQNWLKSVLEINAPLFWTSDQWSTDVTRNRRGGFFGAYVVFNLLLLVGFSVRELILNKKGGSKNREARVALISAIAMSLVPLNFPQSHELRYFMYWMICLVSFNLYLISLPKNRQLIGRWLQPKYMGLIYTVFLTIVLVKIGRFYVQPSFLSLDNHIAFGVKSEFINQIQPNEKVCLLSRHMGEDTQTAPTAALKYAFLYSSRFHLELGYDYSIQAALNPEYCGDRTIIPNPDTL